MKNRSYLIPIFILVLLSCSMEPRYNPPGVQIPTEWKTAQQMDQSGPPCQDKWWVIFNDPLLNQLEEKALQNNRNLYVAFQRVLKARAVVGIEGSRLYPQLDGSLGYSRDKFLFEFFSPPPCPGSPVCPINPSFRVDATSYSLPFTLFYEVDLFGKLRSARKAAFCDYQAEQSAYIGARLILAADLAVNYFQLRSLDAQKDLLEEIVESRKSTLELINERYTLGLTNFSDVTRAETQLYNAEYDLISINSMRSLKENAIALLLGVPPSLLTISHNPLKSSPPEIPAGIPSKIMLMRPDIREAERKVAEQNARIGQAYSSFFPSISLTGIFGFLSPDLKDFLSAKAGLTSLGANVSQPIFDGYRLASNLQAAYALFREASGNYQQTVLTAFKEVEDALTRLQYIHEEIVKIEMSSKSAEETTKISRIRYRNGVTFFLEVADSQRTELELNKLAIDLLNQQYAATIHLIKALGGAWTQQDEWE